MRDNDGVALFQEISRLQVEIRRNGATPARCFRLASLNLAIGEPDVAIAAVIDILDGPRGIVLLREALWLSALALSLKIAIMRGEIEGAPAFKPPPKTDLPALRTKAIALLGRILDRDAEETRLLRTLKQGNSLRFLADFVRME